MFREIVALLALAAGPSSNLPPPITPGGEEELPAEAAFAYS
ncbi:MAG TPA: hypothetical protein VL242_01625 [Sorangium sp.]|nr:hypothetical protein [Sorangium sp.]